MRIFLIVLITLCNVGCLSVKVVRQGKDYDGHAVYAIRMKRAPLPMHTFAVVHDGDKAHLVPAEGVDVQCQEKDKRFLCSLKSTERADHWIGMFLTTGTKAEAIKFPCPSWWPGCWLK